MKVRKFVCTYLLTYLLTYLHEHSHILYAVDSTTDCLLSAM